MELLDKPRVELGREIDKSNAYMEFERNQMTIDCAIVSTSVNGQAAAFLVAILMSGHRIIGYKRVNSDIR